MAGTPVDTPGGRTPTQRNTWKSMPVALPENTNLSVPTGGLPSIRGSGRLRLRTKLTLILLLAALLPVAGASTMAVGVVLSNLESGVRDETERTLRVTLNLVLGQVREIFEASLRISEIAGLPELVTERPQEVAELLHRREPSLPAGLIEITDARGTIVARQHLATLERFQLADGAPLIQRALNYERHVTLERVGRALVVRATSPLVDDKFRRRGAVVVTVPLDGDFAARLKAEMSADVVFYAGDEPIASSFVAADGKREAGFAAPLAGLEAVRSRGMALTEVTYNGRSYAVGYSPLIDFEDNRLGLIAIAANRENEVRAKAQAWRLLVAGAVAAALLALLLAGVLSRRITLPIGHLHVGALAVARGELDTRFARESGDEIGDLAEAFAQMTEAVRANQEKLSARMREITTLHDIGRAITSVLGLDEVLRKIVEEVAEVLGARRCALLLSDSDGKLHVRAGVGLEGKMEMSVLAEELAWRGGTPRIDDVEAEVDLRAPAANAGVKGSVLAVPLEQKDRVLGLLLVNRSREVLPFGEADARLVATLARQAATAIQNARLFAEVQRSAEELEVKVEERTYELVVANQELERTLHELGQAQNQVVLSERMAGLGALVAGVAHEINSPAGAIQGAVDMLGENVSQLARRARELGDVAMTPEDRMRFFALVEELVPRLAAARVEAPAVVRRQARELAAQLEALGVHGALEACRTLVEIGAPEAARQLASLGVSYGLAPLVGYLEQYAYLHRNTQAIRTAIRRITRIIGALKSYSHLDQAKVTVADLHEGIENTLIILQHELKYGINITRKYAELPSLPLYVDELNQVWTNLIHNAVQALGGKGEIVIVTRLDGADVAVSVVDSGPGIPEGIVDRIFDPFFTTKARGEGTGLGLGIVKQIVEKHGGRMVVASAPGRTEFTVRLPVAGPPRLADEPLAALG